MKTENEEILTEMISRFETQMEMLHALADSIRKENIGILQALRQNIEDRDYDRAIDVADKTNASFVMMMESINKKYGGKQ